MKTTFKFNGRRPLKLFEGQFFWDEHFGIKFFLGQIFLGLTSLGNKIYWGGNIFGVNILSFFLFFGGGNIFLWSMFQRNQKVFLRSSFSLQSNLSGLKFWGVKNVGGKIWCWGSTFVGGNILGRSKLQGEHKKNGQICWESTLSVSKCSGVNFFVVQKCWAQHFGGNMFRSQNHFKVKQIFGQYNKRTRISWA